MRQAELRALISLIDDPDHEIYSQVRNRILELGPKAVSRLEKAWEDGGYGGVFQKRVEELIDTIGFNETIQQLQTWKNGGGESLLEGTLIVSRYRYPDLDIEKVGRLLQEIRQDIWLEFDERLTDIDKVQVFNRIFFQTYGFSGDRENYHALSNNYINDVLDRKKGGPLMLAIVYQVIAEDLGLPIRGVNLPNHFILAYLDRGALLDGKEEPIFYINPFSQGDILGRKEIDEYLDKLKIQRAPFCYLPCSNIHTVRRQINNLASSYMNLGDNLRADDLGQMRQILSS